MNTYNDPFIEATSYMFEYNECAPANKSDSIHYVNEYTLAQVNARIVQGTQPKRNFRKNMFWEEILEDGTENFAAEQTPESYAWYAFPVSTDTVIIELSENTNRA
jgi:hypothetical protein